MGLRLAQLEFAEMKKELSDPALFDLMIDFPKTETLDAPFLPSIFDQYSGQYLPKLNVPLGRISWCADPNSLPVIGIHCRDQRSSILQSALLDLLKTNHANPFARFVFVCESIRPIPFLGRYGFAYEYLGRQPFEMVSDRLVARYDIVEIRDLIDGRVLNSFNLRSSD